MLHIYNTLSREVEPFKPLSQTGVKVYYCWPTVYNFAHIGNLRTYLFEDVVIRSLRFLGYKVQTTMNITDIDDKTIRDSIKTGENLMDFTQRYTKSFLEDLAALRIIPADEIVPISTLTDEMIMMIQWLIDKGFAYLADDGSVYYRISKFKSYGDLAHLDMSGMKTSVRINNDEYAKDSAADFALWKAYDATSDGANKWNAEFMVNGKMVAVPGRPGWHIECSACNLKHLGPQIDIHMGGVDNIFPHHQNEIAQSEAFTGKSFSTYWMHGEHLLVEGKKMAKSANNFYTLRDLYEKLPEIPPKQIARAFRLLSFTTSYRETFNFTFTSLTAGLKTLESFDAILDRIRNAPTVTGKVRKDVREFVQMAMLDFVDYLEDDINMPEALARIHECINDINRVMDSTDLYTGEISAVVELLKSFDTVLGLFDFERLTAVELPEDIVFLVQQRDMAKANKDFSLSDSFRDQLEGLGYVVTDTKTGTKVQKK